MGEYCIYDRIIFIGMPCSGKSSIGRSVAQYYDYAFIDMDEEIVKKAGMSVEEIFAQLGAEKFREIETAVAHDLKNKKKAVIATGGGIVTRPDNMKLFQQEGSFIIFIHRDFLRLATTPKRIMDKRPLLKSTSYDKLLALYRKRLPLYREYADFEVSNDRNKEDAIAKIVRIIFRKSAQLE